MPDVVDILFKIAVGIAAFFGAWWINRVTSSVDALQTKVQAIELLVAGQYVKRDDMEKFSNTLFHKLDRIENMLHTKVDKP